MIKAVVLCLAFCLGMGAHLRESQDCTTAMLGNGTCDQACNNREFTYDNGDCKCLPVQMGNGHCDPLCNTAQYFWDRGDCADPNAPPTYEYPPDM